MNKIEKSNFKPEFGNVKQIEKLKEYQKKQEALEKSNRYKVRMDIRSRDTFIVEAENKDEALEKAHNQYFQSLCEIADLDMRIVGKALPRENNNINNNTDLFKEAK